MSRPLTPFEEMFGPFPTTLAEWQQSRMVHPYTCPNRDQPGHYDNGRDHGCLIVVDESHLRCDVCGFEQTVTAFSRLSVEPSVPLGVPDVAGGDRTSAGAVTPNNETSQQ